MNRIESGFEEAVCAFSPNGSLLAVATTDGLLKTFDTGTGRLSLTLDTVSASSSVGHLHQPQTALAWAPLSGQEEADESQQSMLVAGSAMGGLQAFNALTGAALWSVPDAHDGPVTSIALLKGCIYSCGADDKLRATERHSGKVLSTYTGETASHVKRVTSATGGENVMVAGSELFLCTADLKRQIRWFTGHTMEAHILATDQDGTFAVSGSPAERSLAVWDLKPKKKKAQLSAAAVLSMEHPALHAAVLRSQPPSGSDRAACFGVAAVGQGGAYAWECLPQGSGQVAAELRLRIHPVARQTGSQTESMLAIRLEAAGEGSSLVLARGTTAKPHLERFAVPASGSQDVQLQPLEEGLLFPSKKGKTAQKEPKARAAVVSSEAVLPNGHPDHTPSAEDAEQRSSRKRAAEQELEQPADAAQEESRAEGTDAGHEGGEAWDRTLGERVRALQKLQGAGPPAAEPAPAAQSKPSADSLAVLLSQGVRSQDKGLIERCLGVSNEAMVTKTVANISSGDAVALLEVAVQRLKTRANRGHNLSVWIRAVLMKHTAALMASPGQQRVLSSLYQTIESRLALQKPLTELSGRLDLLLAQVPSASDAPGTALLPLGPTVHVTGHDNEDVQVEDPFAPEPESSDDGGMAEEDGSSQGEEQGESSVDEQ